MSQTVIIAEKPSVARDIARVLGALKRTEGGWLEGNGYAVTWALGHLYTQMNPDEIDPKWKAWRADALPILPDVIPLKPAPRSRSQIAVIRKLVKAKETREIICATDAGREGELIFRRIAQELKIDKPMRRLWISSMTDEAIREGFAKLRPLSDYDPLYHSARCRADADWLVGMNGSRAFTLRYDALLSVGRVQTPTLAILVARRREIEAFVPEKYCEVEADFGDYRGTWIAPDGKSRIAKEEEAKAIAAAVRGKAASVALAKREKKSTPPPRLYDLTSLQRDANRVAGLTADATLKAAQSLYEKHKAVTYPRTDSQTLPRDMIGGAGKALRALKGPYAGIAALVPEPPPSKKRVFDDAGVTDHHAIIPTTRAPGTMTAAEQTVYDLIARRFVAAFLEDYRYEAMRVETVSEGHRFLSTGTRPIEPGWKAAYGTQEDEREKEKEPPLPDLAAGDARTVASAKVKKKTTKPPPPHTEASLLGAMEHAGREIEDEALRDAMKESGLGTPATRAAIIERLLQVGYAQRKGRALNATDKGVALIGVAPAELASPETTGKWERGLRRIREGGMEPDRFMQSIRRFAAWLCERAAGAQGESPFPKEERGGKGRRKAAAPKAVAGAVCPLCGGKVVATPRGYGCANWKEKGCKFTIWKDMAQGRGGPEVSAEIVSFLLKNGRADVPGGRFTMREGRAYYEKT